MIGRIAGRFGHRLRAREHVECFLIEYRRSRTLHDTAAQQVPFMVNSERDLRDTLFAVCPRRRRVALEAFEMGGERALPSDEGCRGVDRGSWRRRRRPTTTRTLWTRASGNYRNAVTSLALARTSRSSFSSRARLAAMYSSFVIRSAAYLDISSRRSWSSAPIFWATLVRLPCGAGHPVPRRSPRSREAFRGRAWSPGSSRRRAAQGYGSRFRSSGSVRSRLRVQADARRAPAAGGQHR